MDGAGAGSGDANADFACEFRPGASHKGRGFFVPYLNEPNFVLIFAKRFDNAIHSVAGYSEDCIDVPVDESFNEYIASCFRHPVRVSNPKVMRRVQERLFAKGHEGRGEA